ncbi:MAG: hypothetical protein KC583_00215, partial [Myxococcales bacterium]|nr:hypothetical protein [Myxococcales bacterium]
MRSHMMRGLLIAVALVGGSTVATGQGLIGSYPVPATPAANPPNAAMARLGKALFHESQLGFSQEQSCADCHQHPDGGVTGGLPNGGADGLFGTADDNFGAPGVIRTDA